jgi:taurine dioxygenase
LESTGSNILNRHWTGRRDVRILTLPPTTGNNTSGDMTLQLKSTDRALGMEIEGLDLRQPLSASDSATLKDAVLRHHVVFLRNQHLDSQGFVDFARSLGEIESYESTLQQYLLPKQPEVIVLSNIEENGKAIGVVDAGSFWHTDRSYVKKPAWLSVLYALEVPYAEDGTPVGDTEFASMTAAVKAMPPAKRERLERLFAEHQYVFRWSKDNGSMPPVRHPVILKHPVSKVPCLFVNGGFTHRILDLPEAESRELLDELFAYATQRDFVYRHQWKAGDVLLWDNYATQHLATGGYKLPQRRHLWRTTIQGFELQ